ncbi:MAG: phage tail tape measure protein [Lentilactobacillus diolivorans]
MAGDLMRDEGIGVRFEADLAPLIKANELTDKLVDKWTIINKQLAKTGDTTGLSRGMAQANTEIKRTGDLADRNYSQMNRSINQSIDSVNRLGDATKRTGNEGSNSLNIAAKHTKLLGRAADSTKDKVSGMWNRATNSEATQKTNDNLNKVDEHLSRVGNSANKSGNKVSESQRRTRSETDKTTTSFGRLKDAGSRLTNMGNTIAMAMIPVAAAFKKSADEATELENRYKTIQNLLHTGGESASASKAQTRAMEKENNQFALQYGVSPTAMAKGGEELIRRGYSGNQELASHKYFLQAARASGDPYSAVVNYGAPALEQFGYKTKAGDSQKKMAAYTKMVLNQMAYGADLSATDFSGMGESLKYAGATAKSGNQSLASTISDVGVLSNNGQDGSVAGTGLRKVINSLLAPSSGMMGQGVSALKSIGLTPDDLRSSKGNLKSLDDEFELLNRHMKGMTGTQKATLFHQLFGATGQESALILSNNVKQMKSLNAQVEKAPKYGKGGYIQDLAQKNMSSWQNQIDVFKQHLNVMGLDFTKTVLPGITQALKIGNKILGDLIAMPKPLKTVAGYATAIAAAAGTAYVSYKMLGKATAALSDSHGMGNMKMGNSKANVAEDVAMNSMNMPSEKGTKSRHSLKGLFRSGLFGNAASNVEKSAPKIAEGGRMSKLLSGAKMVGSKIPWLDVALTSTTLMGMNKHNAGSKIGNFGGTLAGMEGGAALGSFLGPAGTFIGGSLGAAAGSWLGSKTGKQIQKSLSPQTNRASESPKRTNRRAYNPLNSLPKDAQLTTKKALGYVEKANKGWIKTNYDTWSKSKHLSADYQSQNLIYDKLGKNLDRFVNRQQSSSNKSISYLQKIGAIHAATAQKSYNEEAHWGNSRKQVINHDLQAIKTDEQNGGRNRAALVARLDSDIVKITSKGSNKQRQIYQKLQNSTSNLSYGQYRSVLKYSNRAERATLASARKSYNGQVSTAEATYRHTLKSAKQVYGVHSSEYQSVKKFAQRQYDKATTAAEKQYEGTKHWAEQQRKKVVNQAKLQATEVANSLLTATGKLGGQLGRILSENALAGIVTQSTKQKKNGLTNTIARNNRGNRNAKTANEATLSGLPTYSPGAITNSRHLTAADRKVQRRANSVGIQTLPGHALGGKINRAQTALVGEGGLELAYTVRGRKARLLGVNGPQLAHLKPGEHILNAQATKRVLAGDYGQSLPGYANGTNKLGTSGATGSLDKLSKKSKSAWEKTYSDTSKSTKKIKKNTIDDYDATQKGSVIQLSQLSKQNRSQWSNIYSKTGDYTSNIRKSSIKDFDSMQKGVQGQMNQVRKGVTNAADDTATGFGHALGRMDNYAHKAMSDTINQLNNGIKGIDKSLGQFGGNNSVINPIHYAQGSNGQLSEDQIAMVNDAESGPWQEGVLRGNQLYAPQGKKRILGLKRGDAVLNGTQMQRLSQARGITHYAKGSGVSDSALRKIAKANSKNPASFWNKNFNVNVKVKGPDLQKGITKTAKSGMTKYGVPWANAGWGIIAGLIKNAVSSNSSMVRAMKKYGSGHRYVYGAGGPTNFDCSGLVMYALKHAYGISVPHNSAAQYHDTSVFQHISPSSAKPGDALFWGPGSHVGIYEGHGKYYSAYSDRPQHGYPEIGSYPVHGYGGDGQLLAARIKGVPNGTSNKHAKRDPLASLFKKELGKSALKWIENNLQVSGGSFGGQMGGSSITKAMIKKAESVMKVPSSIRGKVMSDIIRMAFSESGNRNIAQQIHDSNSASGNPAGGPLQFVKSTFLNYAVSGHKNWNSPYDQVLAYLNNSQYKNATGMTTIWGKRKFDWLGSGPHGTRRFARGGIPQTNKASIVGEKGAELFLPNVSGRVFTAKDTAVMATNMMKASLSVGKMLRELERVIKKPAVSASSYRHVAKTEPTVHIETHDKFEFNIGSGVELNQRTIDKMIKQALKGERQNMARQIIEQFGGTK